MDQPTDVEKDEDSDGKSKDSARSDESEEQEDESEDDPQPTYQNLLDYAEGVHPTQFLWREVPMEVKNL